MFTVSAVYHVVHTLALYVYKINLLMIFKMVSNAPLALLLN